MSLVACKPRLDAQLSDSNFGFPPSTDIGWNLKVKTGTTSGRHQLAQTRTDIGLGLKVKTGTTSGPESAGAKLNRYRFKATGKTRPGTFYI